MSALPTITSESRYLHITVILIRKKCHTRQTNTTQYARGDDSTISHPTASVECVIFMQFLCMWLVKVNAPRAVSWWGHQVCQTTSWGMGASSLPFWSIQITCPLVIDLVGSLTSGRDRFTRELERMRGYSFRRLLIIGSRREIEEHVYRSKARPAAILGSLWTFEVRSPLPIGAGRLYRPFSSCRVSVPLG